MKKNLYTKMLNSAVHMFTMMFLLFWCGNANAAVQGTGTIEDPYVLAVGETYQVTAFKELYCTFTATENGTLEVPYNSPQLVVYTDATYQTQAETQPAAETGNYTYCTLNCVAGTTYYLGAISPVPMDNGSFTIDFYTDGKPISLVNINPVEGSVITASTDVIDMKFNQNITMDQTCTMTSGDNSETLSTQVLGTFANTSFKNKLAQWYIDGKVAKGDEIKFKFTGIKANNEYANLYNETGELELTYVLGAKPMMLVSTTNTPNGDPSMSTFLSYYAYGAEAGVVTLTFDGEVNTESVPTAELGYGNRQGEDEYYLETFSTTVEGNTVIVDLRGKLRDKEVIGYIDGINTIMLTVKGVKDVDGNNTYTDLSGSTGKYSFIYDYENIEYSVDTDATLDNGSTINNDTKSIELWFNETGGTATYTGVELKYISGGEEKYTYFSLDDLTIAKSGTETTITIPMPAINIDENSTVTVSLTDVVRPDGKTTVEDFTATFTCDGRTAPVLVVTPAPESSVTALDKVVFGCTEGIKINANATEPIVIYKNRNTVVATIALADLVADDDFTFSYTLAEPVTEETTYRISIPEGTFLLGAKENANEATYVTFSVSTPTVLNVIPANESTIESLSQITFNCEKGIGIDWNITEPIVIYKGRTEVARITGEDLTQPEDWDDIYNLFYTFPEPITEEGAYRVVIPQGLFLLGTWGETSSEATTISYTISTPTVLNVIPANESTIESLSQITFNCEQGIGIDWNCTTPITISKRDMGNVVEVAQITGEDLTWPDDWDDIYNLFYNLAEPITEAGTYIVNIPAGFFIFGEYGDAANEATIVYYTVQPPVEILISPEPGTVAEIPTTLTLTLPANGGFRDGTAPILTDADGNSYNAVFELHPTDWNKVNIILDAPITTDGTYTLTIPAGSLEWEPEYVAYDKELTFVFVVSAATGIDEFVKAEGGKVDVYAVNGTIIMHNADAAKIKTLKKGLYVINGKKIIIK